MLNVRLDKKTEEALKEYSKRKNVAKSTVVKDALSLYLAKEKYDQSPFALGEDLFGAAASGGDGTASTHFKSKLKEKLNAKHSH